MGKHYVGIIDDIEIQEGQSLIDILEGLTVYEKLDNYYYKTVEHNGDYYKVVFVKLIDGNFDIRGNSSDNDKIL